MRARRCDTRPNDAKSDCAALSNSDMEEASSVSAVDRLLEDPILRTHGCILFWLVNVIAMCDVCWAWSWQE